MKFSINSAQESLREEVELIAFDEGRMVGTAGHAKAERILERRLTEIGCRPYKGRSMRIPYEKDGMDFVNLVGVIPGTSKGKKAPLLVGAHYDSVIPAPCADDNAAAVAIALQVGKEVAQQGGLERDMIVAIFDAEEPPYFQSSSMGSTNFYNDQLNEQGVHAAIIIDLVGHDVSVNTDWLGGGSAAIGKIVSMIPGLSDRDIGIPGLKQLLAVTGCESHPELAGILDCSEQPSDLKILPLLNEYVGDMSDHGVFRKNKVPYFFLSCGRWAHYHQPTDTPDRLNYEKMARITQWVLSLLEGLDEAELESFNKLPDTTELEASYLQSALGPVLCAYLRQKLGISEIRTRQDITGIVRHIMSLGL